jgi:hypothetical protein
MRIALAGGSCNAHPSGTSPRYLVKKTTGWVFQAVASDLALTNSEPARTNIFETA